MRMLVVSISIFGVVAVGMFMLQNFMRMWVTVRLHKMQSSASQHQ
jgi:hypothetical protein